MLDTFLYCSQSYSLAGPLARPLSLELASLAGLAGQQASGPAISVSPVLGVEVPAITLGFPYGCCGFKPRASCLCYKHFLTEPSSASQLVFYEENG